jgi:hypothetical protein
MDFSRGISEEQNSKRMKFANSLYSFILKDEAEANVWQLRPVDQQFLRGFNVAAENM